MPLNGFVKWTVCLCVCVCVCVCACVVELNVSRFVYFTIGLHVNNFSPKRVGQIMNVVHTDALIDQFTSITLFISLHIFLSSTHSTYMSCVLILSKPIARAFSFPSAMIAATAPAGKSSSIRAPLDVKPGHIMLAPDKTNLMAPRSTCNLGSISGSSVCCYSSHVLLLYAVCLECLHLCNKASVGRKGPSKCWKKRISPLTERKVMCSWLKQRERFSYNAHYQCGAFVCYPLIWMMGVFLGINSSKTVSILGYNSFNFVRMFLWTEDLSWDWPAMFSEKLNLLINRYISALVCMLLLTNIYFLNMLRFLRRIERWKKKWVEQCASSTTFASRKKMTKKPLKAVPKWLFLTPSYMQWCMMFIPNQHVTYSTCSCWHVFQVLLTHNYLHLALCFSIYLMWLKHLLQVGELK